MNVYFDNAATTRVREEAAQLMLRVMTEDYGNPSSTHYFGRRAKEILDTARENVAAAIGADASEIYFTSGGTEADNWAILSGAEKMRHVGKHIIISAYEHDAINKPCAYLEDRGWEITRLSPDEGGYITADAVKNALRDDTVLVSVMFVNNELGTINPIREIANVVHKNSKALMHTDAVQALCKTMISVSSLGVDLMSVSSHKIHGPKGCGALYMKKGIKLPAHIMGGAQENTLRAGTEALPAIAGFGEAARLGKKEMAQSIKSMQAVKDTCIRLLSEITEVVFIGDGKAPHILSISLPGYKSEVLMNWLEREGICVSKSSACKKGKRSHVLEAMGLDAKIIDGAVRISFSKYSTVEEAEYFALKLREASQKILKVL